MILIMIVENYRFDARLGINGQPHIVRVAINVEVRFSVNDCVLIYCIHRKWVAIKNGQVSVLTHLYGSRHDRQCPIA